MPVMGVIVLAYPRGEKAPGLASLLVPFCKLMVGSGFCHCESSLREGLTSSRFSIIIDRGVWHSG